MSAGDHKVCRWCGKLFRLYCAEPWSSGSPKPARSRSIHNIDPAGNFCTLRDAARYGTHYATQKVREERK